MRVRSIAVALLLLASLIGWLVAGCRQSAEQAQTASEEAEHEHEHEAEAELPGETAQPDAEQVAAQAEETLSIKVDYDRSYDPIQLERLRGLLMVGNPEHKQRALAALKDLLKNSRVVSVRQQVAGILGSAPEEALQELADTARNDTDAGVRAVAIESLSHAPASESLMAILADLQRNAEDAAVRSAALTAEMQMRVAAPEQWLTVDYLSRMLAQREDDATAQLQMLLVQEKKGLPALIKVLETAPDPVARAAAACSISLICAGTNPRQQEFARLALTVKKESIPEPGPANLEGLKPLERALARDPSPEVRAMAAQGLGYLGQESSAPLLGKALHDPSEEVRWWAALALITVPAEAALKDLSHAAGKDPSARVREAAVRALGWIKGEAPLRPLVRATADMHASVRQAAATELGRFRQEIARDALIALFEDPSEDVRWAAVLAVGEMRDREAAPALVKALRDPSPMVSNAAERALQRMGIGERRFGTREEET